MKGAAVPEANDVSPQLPPARPHEVGDFDGLQVARLETQAQVLAFRGYREGRQCREGLMCVAGWDDRRGPLRGPRPAAGRKAQNTAFSQDGQMRSQASGFF